MNFFENLNGPKVSTDTEIYQQIYWFHHEVQTISEILY